VSLNATLFACGSMVLGHPLVCGLGALRAEKPHIYEMEQYRSAEGSMRHERNS
jgi:hypothetical protein